MILGSNRFLCEYLMPLKLAKDITERKSRQSYSDGGQAAFAGTVIGSTLGFSYLTNTLLFANITFIIDRIVILTSWSACLFLCLLLFASIVILAKPLRIELL